MRKIYPLPESVIAKIAAGEVIERPVYAVKELIENAIDAEADRITIYLENSGLKKISVIDNGTGMTAEDLQECYKPHTTSKIASEEELSTIASLGFRGEALSSIAAISRMFIKSRTEDAALGTLIEVEKGTMQKKSPAGMAIGTHITVEDLFYTLPGRKKYLKSKRSEYRLILETITHFALTYPHIHFSFFHNNRQVFDLIKVQDVSQRINFLLGNDLFTHLLPVSYKDKYITVTGFISRPQIVTHQRHKQYFFVNQRKITNTTIATAVKDAYGTLLESLAYPVCILYISLPFELVDVNIHPRKEEVRFSDNQFLYDAIYKAVTQTLAKNNLTFYSDNLQGISIQDKSITQTYAGRLLREKKLPWQLLPLDEITPAEVHQIHKLYLLSVSKQGLILIDQHAAHERILFEQLLEEFTKKKQSMSQFILPKPEIIELSYSDSELLQEFKQVFTDYGFSIEHFRENAFVLHAVPLLLQDRNSKEIIADFLSDLHQEKRIQETDRITKKMLTYLACRGAVKAGDALTKKQCKELVEKLATTSNNTTCPHGRPTKIIIPIDKVHRMFKRK